MKFYPLATLLFLFSSALHAAVPEEYEVTDITGWTGAQIGAIPYFDRYVPDGASGDYRATARSGFGVTIGNRDFTNAANDAGHIIATGHLDGSDFQNTHTILLSPDLSSKPAVTPLRPTVGATTATLRAKINAADLSATYQFQPASGGSSGGGTANGTSPLMAEHTLTGLISNTTYTFNATATNSEGTVTGLAQTFTTPWDWPSWSAAHGMANPNMDANSNGLPDLVDFATGTEIPPSPKVEADVLKLTYRQALNTDGVELKVEISDDLTTWIDAPITETTRTPDGSDRELITVCIDAGIARRFTRLTAILQ